MNTNTPKDFHLSQRAYRAQRFFSRIISHVSWELGTGIDTIKINLRHTVPHDTVWRIYEGILSEGPPVVLMVECTGTA